MKSRAAVDPQLHALRSLSRSAEGRERTQLESARFNLYSAFERGDATEARQWARSLRMAVLVWQGNPAVKQFAFDALTEIDAAIEASRA